MPRISKIQLRRDTASNWTSVDPTLAEGEFGWETDTGKAKLGDGTTAWSSLGYITTWGSGGGTSWGSITGTLSSQTDLQTALDAKASSSHTHATTDITSGTFADARIASSNVTQHQALLSITESQISDLGSYITASSVDTLTNKSGSISQWTNDAGYITSAPVTSVNSLTGAVVLDADAIDDTSTTNKFTTASDISKLAGIEASADVTDTANVTAAGALMDSEVDANIKTLVLPASTTISTFGATLIDDADAVTARTTLNVDVAGTDNSITPAPAAFQATGSTNITTTAATIVLNTEVFDPDNNYSNSLGEITCTLSGYYNVSVNVPINDDGSTGTTRGRVYGWLEQDQTTSTWISVDNIRGQVYERELSGGTGLHMGGIVYLSAGEAIRARIQVSSSVDVSTESGEASLNIHRIRAA